MDIDKRLNKIEKDVSTLEVSTEVSTKITVVDTNCNDISDKRNNSNNNNKDSNSNKISNIKASYNMFGNLS